jgi:hypothetical protein
LGINALRVNTGHDNSAFGNFSYSSNTTGYDGVAVGWAALYNNLTGYQCTAVGKFSLYGNTTGYRNVALGRSSMFENNIGYEITAVGYNSGRYIADGVTGNQASNTSLYLGANTKSLASGDSNEIVIGYNTIGAGSNTATLGNTSITSTVLRGTVLLGSKARLAGYTVATLPAGAQGDTAFVTDATAPTFLGALVGGGAVVTPVFYNGAAWVSF